MRFVLQFLLHLIRNDSIRVLGLFLHRSCISADDQFVSLLLKHSADVNQENSKGETPLMLAVEYGCLQIVKLLVENGAKIEDRCLHTASAEILDFLCEIKSVQPILMMNFLNTGFVSTNVRSYNGV